MGYDIDGFVDLLGLEARGWGYIKYGTHKSFLCERQVVFVLGIVPMTKHGTHN